MRDSLILPITKEQVTLANYSYINTARLLIRGRVGTLEGWSCKLRTQHGVEIDLGKFICPPGKDPYIIISHPWPQGWFHTTGELTMGGPNLRCAILAAEQQNSPAFSEFVRETFDNLRMATVYYLWAVSPDNTQRSLVYPMTNCTYTLLEPPRIGNWPNKLTRSSTHPPVNYPPWYSEEPPPPIIDELYDALINLHDVLDEFQSKNIEMYQNLYNLTQSILDQIRKITRRVH